MPFARQCLHLSLISLWFTFFCGALAQDVPPSLGEDSLLKCFDLDGEGDDHLAERTLDEQASWNRVLPASSKVRPFEGGESVIDAPHPEAVRQAFEHELRELNGVLGSFQGRAPPIRN